MAAQDAGAQPASIESLRAEVKRHKRAINWHRRRLREAAAELSRREAEAHGIGYTNDDGGG